MNVEETATRAWDCHHCGAHNVTSAADVFAEQCRNCTEYNDIDWTDDPEMSLSEASAVARKAE